MPGLIRGVARTAVIAGTATAVSNRVSRRQAGRWAAKEQQAAEQQGYPPEQQGYPPEQEAYPPAPPTVPVEELKQLADLHDQGVLTDEEFQQQKARLLGN